MYDTRMWTNPQSIDHIRFARLDMSRSPSPFSVSVAQLE